MVTVAWPPATGRSPLSDHGQFNMLTAFGVGEAAISVSRPSASDGPVEHTVRDVGPVTTPSARPPWAAPSRVRGPFGTGWAAGPTAPPGADAVIVAGGIGLAPLRGLARDLVDRQRRGEGRLCVLVGARSPTRSSSATSWRRGATPGRRRDHRRRSPSPGWTGPVGVVTTLLDTAPFDPGRTVAFVCGPEIMMRFTARDLVDRGVDPGAIRVSLERNMQCGIGLCGHCQLGPLLVCRDGPVVPYARRRRPAPRERER